MVLIVRTVKSELTLSKVAINIHQINKTNFNQLINHKPMEHPLAKYECYNTAIAYLNKKVNSNKPVTHDDIEVKLLVGQYSLGIYVKKELYNKLLRMNIIKE